MSATDPGSRPRSPDDRGQALTLEGVISALVVMLGLLFALQSTVITPTTGGAVSDETRAQLRQKANDVLIVMANNGSRDLAWYVRYWNPNTRTFRGARRPDIGYGDDGPPGSFGTLLDEMFTEKGRHYNLVLRYRGNESPSDSGVQRMVYQGPPAEHAVVATYTVTLYDSNTLTGPKATTRELRQYDTNATDNDEGYYPIPDVVSGPVYNVVEVRLVVW